MVVHSEKSPYKFYNSSIFSGAKIVVLSLSVVVCFIIAQFFQVLKYIIINKILKYSFIIAQFFQVLKFHIIIISNGEVL